MTLVWVLSLLGCATNPATGESEFSLVSEAQELEVGKQYYGPTIQSFDGGYPDPSAQSYVNRVGQHLASLSHRPAIPYEFTIVNTSMINAFALPGGKICITRGLLSRQTNESQLAAVLGHEIGHVTARHGAAGMTRQMVLGGLLSIGAAALDYKQVSGREAIVMAGAVGVQAVIAKYSRGQESQSDELGMGYMTKAGYHPRGAVELFEIFQKLQQKDPSFVEKMFASHPQSLDRMKNAETLIAAKYQASSGPTAVVNTDDFKKLSEKLKVEAPFYEAHDRGNEAASKKQWNLAIQEYKKALSGKPEEALFHADIGFAYMMNKDLAKTEEHLKKAYEIYPNFFKPQYFLGYFYYQNKNYGSALHYLNGADKLVPGIPMLRLVLGESYEGAGSVGPAVELYKYVYQADPQGNLGRTAYGHLVRLGAIQQR